MPFGTGSSVGSFRQLREHLPLGRLGIREYVEFDLRAARWFAAFKAYQEVICAGVDIGLPGNVWLRSHELFSLATASPVLRKQSACQSRVLGTLARR